MLFCEVCIKSEVYLLVFKHIFLPVRHQDAVLNMLGNVKSIQCSCCVLSFQRFRPCSFKIYYLSAIYTQILIILIQSFLFSDKMLKR